MAPTPREPRGPHDPRDLRGPHDPRDVRGPNDDPDSERPSWWNFQRTAAAFLVFLAVLSVVGQLYSVKEQRQERTARSAADDAQRACQEKAFAQLTAALTTRADLQAQEAEVNQREATAERNNWLIYAEAAGLVKDDPTKELPPAEQARIQVKFVKSLLDYKKITTKAEKDRAVIKAKRQNNPVPPYPEGKCDQE